MRKSAAWIALRTWKYVVAALCFYRLNPACAISFPHYEDSLFKPTCPSLRYIPLERQQQTFVHQLGNIHWTSDFCSTPFNVLYVFCLRYLNCARTATQYVDRLGTEPLYGYYVTSIHQQLKATTPLAPFFYVYKDSVELYKTCFLTTKSHIFAVDPRDAFHTTPCRDITLQLAMRPEYDSCLFEVTYYASSVVLPSTKHLTAHEFSLVSISEGLDNKMVIFPGVGYSENNIYLNRRNAIYIPVFAQPSPVNNPRYFPLLGSSIIYTLRDASTPLGSKVRIYVEQRNANASVSRGLPFNELIIFGTLTPFIEFKNETSVEKSKVSTNLVQPSLCPRSKPILPRDPRIWGRQTSYLPCLKKR